MTQNLKSDLQSCSQIENKALRGKIRVHKVAARMEGSC